MILSLITSGYSIDVILMLLIATLISALIAIVFHEASHAFVAHLCGDDTAKNVNRMTLNPIPHFDLVGALLMLFVGFGWAKPVPINPNNFKKRKTGIILVSLAGITTNILIAGLFLLILYLSYPALNVLMASTSLVRLIGFLLYYIIVYSIILNIMLAFFNFLPIAPLDGFNFINVLLPPGNNYSRFMFRYGWYILLGLLIVSNILNYVGLKQFNVFYQVQSLARNLIYLVIGG